MGWIGKLADWIISKITINTCEHKYQSDTQIRVVRCEKCGDERWYEYKKLW